MIVEGYLHGIAGAEAHGVDGFSVAPVVVVAVFGVEDRTGGQEDAAQFADVLGEQAAEAGAHSLKEDEFLLLKDGDVLQVREGLEFLHVELGAVEALLHVFRIAVGVGKQILELNEVVLAAFALVENFAAAVDAFGAVFTGHSITPDSGDWYSTGKDEL